MAKQAKKIQTDYTKGGHEISQTSIPLYTQNLERMGRYLEDPMAAQQRYLDAYYGANAVQNQDFLRAYNRNMAAQTANNWNATHGGYTTSGQRSYADQQRYMNDLASRLQSYGVTSAYNMASGDFQNMLNANTSFHNAYGLGKDYSDIEQYNNAVDQANGSWWAQAMGTAGKAIAAIPTPWTMAIGTAMAGVGDAFTVDASNITNPGGNQQARSGGNYTYTNTNSMFPNMNSVLSNADWGKIIKR